MLLFLCACKIRSDPPKSVKEAEAGNLTVLSGAAACSEVCHTMARPDDLREKTVKMAGAFSVYHDRAAGKTHCACPISDAAACCAQGAEFILDEDEKFPDDVRRRLSF